MYIMISGNQNIKPDVDSDILFTEIYELQRENAKLVTEMFHLREQLNAMEVLAFTDTLTPLPNRRSFLRELDRITHRVTQNGRSAALLYVDVDGLKQINDLYGHQVGDAALIHIADLLQKTLRVTDSVARIGGDEFGLLIDPGTEAEVVARTAKLFSTICATPLIVNGARVKVYVSIGHTMIGAGEDVEAIIARADAAMYAAKHA